MDAVHNSAGPHDGGCLEAECEVVFVGTVQGHQWGCGKTLQPTLLRVLVILKNDLQGGVAQVGREPLCSQTSWKPSYFVSFQLILRLALGVGFVLQPPGLVLRCPDCLVLNSPPPGPVLSPPHGAPTGGVLSHSADIG